MLVALVAGIAAGCGGDDDSESAPAPAEEPAAEAPAEPAEEPAEELSGRIEADGSSTVGPLTTLAAEDFQNMHPDVQITVGISGSGGGFERFCAGETDLSNASRPIKDEEAEICAENGIDFLEFRVATDALTVVVNPANDWASCLTVEQLNAMWGPEAEGTVSSWADVDPSFPDEPLTLAGPGTDSGTFDYFTDVINGEEGASRADYTASEDDNVVVQAVAGETGATGYFGFSYLQENPDTLKGVEIDGGEGCVAPSVETAQSGEYSPLSRPLFVYAKAESFAKPEVAEFMRFFVENSDELATAALYVPLTDEEKAEALASIEAQLSG